MKVLNRWNYKVSDASFEHLKDKRSLCQMGQAYEVRELIQRYVQGNPPDLRVLNSYTKSPSLDAPQILHPFGGDMIDIKEDIDRQKEYAEKLLQKDNFDKNLKKRLADLNEKSKNLADESSNSD